MDAHFLSILLKSIDKTPQQNAFRNPLTYSTHFDHLTHTTNKNAMNSSHIDDDDETRLGRAFNSIPNKRASPKTKTPIVP